MPILLRPCRARLGLSILRAGALVLAAAPLCHAATIGLSADAAPGTSTTFFSFTADYGVIPYVAGVTPGFGNRVSFLGSLANAIPFSDALYTGSPGALSFIFHRGLTQAPGYSPGVAIVGHSPIALFPSGDVAFFATVQFPQSFPLYYGPPGALSIAFRKGDPAPGLPGVTIADFSPSFSPLVSGANMGVSVNLGGAVTPANDTAFFAGPPASLVAVARDGDAVPGSPGVVFDAPGFSNATMNASGRVLFTSGLTGPGVSDHSLWIAGPGAGAYTPVGRTGDPAPGLSASVSLRSFNDSFINNAGQVAFRAQWGTEFSSQTALFGGFPNSLALIARLAFTPAPGASPNASFQSFFELRINGAGRAAFYAALNPPDNVNGLWLTAPLTSAASPALTLIALDTMAAPGTAPGVVFSNVAPGGQRALNMNTRGDIAFPAYVSGPGVTPDTNFGIWAGAPGRLNLVVREGDAFTVAPGDTRIVRDVFLSDAISGGEEGFRSVLNNLGQLTFTLGFADNSYGIFVVQLPHPCPGDANGDGVIDFIDLNAVLSAFGTVGPPGYVGDFNTDGSVDFLDLNSVLSFFGDTC